MQYAAVSAPSTPSSKQKVSKAWQICTLGSPYNSHCHAEYCSLSYQSQGSFTFDCCSRTSFTPGSILHARFTRTVSVSATICWYTALCHYPAYVRVCIHHDVSKSLSGFNAQMQFTFCPQDKNRLTWFYQVTWQHPQQDPMEEGSANKQVCTEIPGFRDPKTAHW